MDNALTYLFQKFACNIIEFLRHWYVRSARLYWYFIINKLERIDYRLAWKITLKNLFKPLYKDYSFLGRVLGFIFRLGRLFLGAIIYSIIFAIAICFYLFWLLIPIALIYQIFAG